MKDQREYWVWFLINALTPVNDLAKADGQVLEGFVVKWTRSNGVFFEERNSITNVWVTENICEEKFVEEAAVAVAEGCCKGSMFRNWQKGWSEDQIG